MCNTALPGFEGRGCPSRDPGPGSHAANPARAGLRPPENPPPEVCSSRDSLSPSHRVINSRGGGGDVQSLAEAGDSYPHARSPRGTSPPRLGSQSAGPGRGCPAAARRGEGGPAGSSSRTPGDCGACCRRHRPPSRPPAPAGSSPRGGRSGPGAPVPGQTWLGPVACGRLGWAAAGAPLLSLPAAQTQAAARAGFPVAPELTSRSAAPPRPRRDPAVALGPPRCPRGTAASRAHPRRPGPGGRGTTAARGCSPGGLPQPGCGKAPVACVPHGKKIAVVCPKAEEPGQVR